MHEVWGMAGLWLGLALFATLLSIWFGIATALSEIVVGGGSARHRRPARDVPGIE